ncbi:Mitochondrial substrate carrier family protein [Melia azedarach]|uniref:Mitochondrial substrate carrier family protein n=2 Tax=Melia azedarach TaxID=155640 RepID=A0ACC1WZP4_MELAZ|nr:Mitochondrial substrate carrier family protein [Melia azedarach]KAJ4704572.1 Mitochondrial substrate carrier family protein [Melia azedarach]
MNMEAARVGVVVEGGQRALNTAHGSVVDASARKFLQPQPQQQQHQNLNAPKRSLNQQQSQIGTVQQLLAGGVAGAFSKTCTAPLARLTILFQVQGMHSDVAALSKPSIWREASRIASEEGFRAFWKGNLVTIAHRLPYSSVNFYAYEHYKNFLQSIIGLENCKISTAANLGVHFVGGGLAGMTAASATYPLDLVRTRLAAQRQTIYYRGIWHSFHTICRDEGFLGLYKGLGATLLGVGPSIAISFSVYESLRSFWQSQRPSDSTVMVSLACGSLSGIASSTATFPIDLVRRRMQLEGAGGRARVYNTGLFGTFRHIIQSEGLRGLYRGILPEYYKVVPGVGIVFMTYEALKMLLSSVPSS